MMQALHSEGFAIEEVVYHRPAGMPLLARIYRPTTLGPHPAVIDAHGGRWCDDSRLTNAAIDAALAADGILVMAIDFRMPPTAQFPLPVADIAFAIRWLHEQADALGIRRDWIGGIGTSSGGHQLALAAMNPDDPRFLRDHGRDLGGVDARAKYMILCWPVSDPPARYAYARERGMDVHVRAHEAYWPSLAAMHDGSPQRIASERRAAYLPPALLIQGDADVILTPDMSDRFAAAYAAAGGDIALRKFAGEGHTFITKAPDSPAARAALAEIADFVHRCTDRAGLAAAGSAQWAGGRA